MDEHQTIIAERGGIRPLARALGHRNHTTVQGWWERKRIPDTRLPGVLALPETVAQNAAA
ncbi:hypothetical protein GCM10008023_05690 [Sphingomonas glacialis]|uniref:Integrase n=1 Tax=Sphingomonas glacialis TaxID=658225 RepID=A0ABQ3LA07_9SPHN|nr:hypothetical protein GCM10008023_05690 [Sphingomonas glacialis]